MIAIPPTGTKVCAECKQELMESDFQYNARAHATLGTCRQCMGKKIRAGRIAKKHGEPTPSGATSTATAGYIAVVPQVVPCPGHVRVCGDDLIAREIPGFFETHTASPLGSEWQVCRHCGDARLVQVFDPAELGNWKPEPVALPTLRVVAKERDPEPYFVDKEGNKHKAFEGGEIATLKETIETLHERYLTLQQQYDTVCEEATRLREINAGIRLELAEMDNLNGQLRRSVTIMHKERDLADAQKLVDSLRAEIERLEAGDEE